ncbi:MAG: type II toxin-antitoxin system VapC family toxin [Verrucomicrobiales bacterium]
MDLIADTTLLVGLWRRQAWAMRFAERRSDRILGIPWVVLGEFRHGAIRAGHDEKQVLDFLSIGIPLCNPEIVVPYYAQLCATLQDQAGWKQIGQNDLWIAATAIAHQCPLVTRNRRHFGMMPGLTVEALEG